MPKPNRVPGFLFNVRNGLFLKFQLNPTAITTSKGNNFQTIVVPGWPEPVVVWSHGMNRIVTFDLFFDSQHDIPNPIPGVGIRDVQAVLESFLFPKSPIRSPNLKALKDALDRTVDEFVPPPRATFVFGPMWYNGWLAIQNIELSNYDRLLIPRHLTAQVTLTVVETGSFFLREDELRRTFATVVYPVNHVVDISNSLASMVGAVAEDITSVAAG